MAKVGTETYLGYTVETVKPTPIGLHLRRWDCGWVELFREGQLIASGHSLRDTDIITLLGHNVTVDEIPETDFHDNY